MATFYRECHESPHRDDQRHPANRPALAGGINASSGTTAYPCVPATNGNRRPRVTATRPACPGLRPDALRPYRPSPPNPGRQSPVRFRQNHQAWGVRAEHPDGRPTNPDPSPASRAANRPNPPAAQTAAPASITQHCALYHSCGASCPTRRGQHGAAPLAQPSTCPSASANRAQPVSSLALCLKPRANSSAALPNQTPLDRQMIQPQQHRATDRAIATPEVPARRGSLSRPSLATPAHNDRTARYRRAPAPRTTEYFYRRAVLAPATAATADNGADCRETAPSSAPRTAASLRQNHPAPA